MSGTAPGGTIAVDTSALFAVLAKAPHGEWVVRQLAAARTRVIAAAGLVELGILIGSRTDGRFPVERVVADAELQVITVDEATALAAVRGWIQFGKGRHPAALNYADCFSYALAKTRDIPLLCLGNDFARTDIQVITPDPGALPSVPQPTRRR